jgi:hypothetical protein
MSPWRQSSSTPDSKDRKQRLGHGKGLGQSYTDTAAGDRSWAKAQMSSSSSTLHMLLPYLFGSDMEILQSAIQSAVFVFIIYS